MKLRDRLGIAFSKNTRANFIQKWLSGETISGNSSYNLDVSGENALKYSAVFACCRILAETFATVPVKEYKKLPNGDREETNDTGYYDILHYKFNDEMSAFAGKEVSMYQLNLGGNVVCTKSLNRFGDVIELIPHKWENVDIFRSNENGKLVYRIKNGVGHIDYSRDEVFHVAGCSTDGVIGMSPIEYAASPIELGLVYENFGKKFYKNGVLSSGVFEHPGGIKDEATKRLREDLKGNYQGFQNIGKPLLLEDGMTFKQLSMKLVDAELLSSKKYQTEDIARFYRIPLHLMQNLDKATNNNIEQQSLEFVMYTMLPWFKRWEDAINTQLLTRKQRDAGYYFEFNLNTLLRGDQKSMYEAFSIGRQWGWLSVNDIRRFLNMNSITNGDIYLEPLNMVEAGTNDNIDSKISTEIANIMKGQKHA